MKYPKLQVVKPMSYPRGGYGTRHLVPGDVFTARNERDHRLLLATKKVREHREPATVPAPSPAVAEQIVERFAGDELKTLRAEYEAKFGKKPFWGWDVDALRTKIAEG